MKRILVWNDLFLLSTIALIVNLQRKINLELLPFREFASSLTEKVDDAEGGDFAVAFVSDRRMRELNKFFRGKNDTTDVLSFPHEPDEFESEPGAIATGFLQDGNSVATAPGSDFLGDIVISAEQAAKQAEENGLTLENEIKQLILHGLLHLCGYDHETDNGEMNARELELRETLGIG
jgi:probable rRNA maturation factor